MNTKLTIVIAEDHAILRDGLRSLLERTGRFDILAEADNGRDAVNLAVSHEPQIVLIDLSMPIINGTEAIPQIRRRLPDTKIIALTMHKAEEFVRAVFAAGANAYVLKDDSHAELLGAVDKVIAGQTYVSSGVSGHVVSGFLSSRRVVDSDESAPFSWDSLSVREREILKLVAGGSRNKEIASHLSQRKDGG